MSCQFIGCTTRACFNFAKTQIGVLCASHRLKGMFNVNSKKCRKCVRQASYNFPDQKTSVLCKQHSEEGMVNVNSKRCRKCVRQASYNFPDQKTSVLCKKHREEGMVCVRSKKCRYKGCVKQPVYNFLGKKKGVTCKEHSEQYMVNVFHKRCHDEKCLKYPTYNYPNQKRALFCKKHSKDGMYIVSKKCCYDDCVKRALYNYPDQKRALFCKLHIEEGMVDVLNKRCAFQNCITQPSYNYFGNHRARFCVLHKSEDMVDTRVYSCDSCGLQFSFKNKSVEKICHYCNPSSALKLKTKELHIKEVIEQAFPDLSFIHDRSIQSMEMIDQKCVYRKFRPDFFFDLKTHVVIVEVDEHQHSSYDASCERVRELHISEAIGRPTYFIRYNPDAYHVNGAAVRVHKSVREKRLVQVMSECLFSDNSKCKDDTFLMRTVFLYYDENN